MDQGQLVTVTHGKIFDVVVDIRPTSKTYKKYFSIDRVFRNEAMDATHLCEFHQVSSNSIYVVIIVLIINYFVLYRKSDRIITFFDSKYEFKKIGFLNITIITIYLIVSTIVCFYFAYLFRNNLL